MASRSGAPVFELLVAFAIVFVLQQIAALAGLVAGLFVLAPPVTANPWTIVTSVYAHSGIGHLLSNAVALVVFGWPVARATTRLRLHTFFLIAGSIAGVSQVVLSSALAGLPFFGQWFDPVGVLGASGAVFALLGYLLASNRLSVGLGSIVDVPEWMTLVVFFVLAAAVTLLTAAPQVALIAHFTGLLVGLLAGWAGLLRVDTQSPERSPTI